MTFARYVLFQSRNAMNGLDRDRSRETTPITSRSA